jgi:hypothetical protein
MGYRIFIGYEISNGNETEGPHDQVCISLHQPEEERSPRRPRFDITFTSSRPAPQVPFSTKSRREVGGDGKIIHAAGVWVAFSSSAPQARMSGVLFRSGQELGLTGDR